MPSVALALVITGGGGAGAEALASADTAPRQLPPEAPLHLPPAPVAAVGAAVPVAPAEVPRPTEPVSPDVPEGEPATAAPPPPAAITAPLDNRSNLTAAAVLHDDKDVDLIPLRALAAYQRSELVMGDAAPQCHLDWTVIAAVGQVLTDHGRHGGGHALGTDGQVEPAIVGPPVQDVQGRRLADSDAGELDGDLRLDRAVGPMLLAPAAWRDVGVDGDTDGQRDPQDIDDAALATAVLLCVEGGDLRRPRHLAVALDLINADPAFASSVMEVASAYADDVASSDPVPTYAAYPAAPTLLAPSVSSEPTQPAVDEPEPRAAEQEGDGQQSGPADGKAAPGGKNDTKSTKPAKPASPAVETAEEEPAVVEPPDDPPPPPPPEPEPVPEPEPEPVPEPEPAPEPTESTAPEVDSCDEAAADAPPSEDACTVEETP